MTWHGAIRGYIISMRIKNIGVIGAGVMGSTIAAHLANVGYEVLLLDIVPKDAPKPVPKDEKIRKLRNQLAEIGVKIFTIGQYLQPTKNNLPVERYVEDDVFNMYKTEGLKIGFEIIESGPLVRSSYNADEQANLIL